MKTVEFTQRGLTQESELKFWRGPRRTGAIHGTVPVTLNGKPATMILTSGSGGPGKPRRHYAYWDADGGQYYFATGDDFLEACADVSAPL